MVKRIWNLHKKCFRLKLILPYSYISRSNHTVALREMVIKNENEIFILKLVITFTHRALGPPLTSIANNSVTVKR